MPSPSTAGLNPAAGQHESSRVAAHAATPTDQIQEQSSQISPSDFAGLPASAQEDAFIDSYQALLAAGQVEEEFNDEQRDGIAPLLKAWFEQAVMTIRAVPAALPESHET